MSIPTSEPPFERSGAAARAHQPRWKRRGLSPVRGLLFIAAFLAILVAGILNYEVVWEVLAEFIPWAFYLGADIVVGAFELVGMAPGPAGMAAVYLGIVAFLVLLYFLLRKAMIWKRLVREALYDYRAMYTYLLGSWSAGARTGLIAWWESLDTLGKVAAAVGAVVLLIPLLIGLSVGLGMLVALLF